MVVLEWLRGKTIFITGGTGFMGKVLIEKLLRCSDVKRIYVLVRPKRGMSATARIENMAKIPCFSKLMELNPAAMKKLIPIEGDIAKENLALKNEDINRLTQETEILFNCAASVRMNDELKMAIEQNTISTYKLLQLAREMKKLQVFAHLSTAFTHCELDVMDEKTYPSSVSPHDIMNIVRWMDDDALKKITPNLLGHHPNSYTFSKRLAEELVADEKKNLPVCIARPCIVIPALKEPLEGWVDSLNGPMGMLVGSGKGVIKTLLCRADYITETIPVDIAINAYILAAYKTATIREEEIPVYNFSISHVVKVTWGQMVEESRKVVHEYPFEGGMWYPEGNVRTNRLVHCMVKLQDRITAGIAVMEYFTTRQWNFSVVNSMTLHNNISEKDKEIFFLQNVDFDVQEYILKAILGTRQYLMKEPLSSLPRARRHAMMLYIISRVTRVIIYGLLAWWAFQLLVHVQAYYGYSLPGLTKLSVIGEYIPPRNV